LKDVAQGAYGGVRGAAVVVVVALVLASGGGSEKATHTSRQANLLIR
jgi:hypothetical protein